MSKPLSTQNQRIALAVALSVLLHGLVLWLPEVKLPQHEVNLPPLIAKLEPLPKLSAKIAKKKTKAKAQPKPQPEPVVQSIPDLPIAASAPLPESAPVVAEPELPASSPVVAEPEPTPPQEPQRPPLPKHARLHFNVYQGEGNFKVGEAVHALEISDGRYTISADVKTTGLASLLKSYHLVQSSSGTATPQTLKPEVFSEEVTDSSGKKTNRADFEWASHTIHFSKGGEALLPPQAQDILSILYQFPPMQQRVEIVSIHIGTGKKFEEYRFEVVFEEKLETALGTLQTIHFRKMHGANEEGLEIWFAQEYRFLPVKIRHLDRAGKISAEAIITDIRVSDE